MHLLLEAVYALAGYDFRSYLAPMLRRRVWQCVRAERLRTISGFQEKALHDPDCLARLIQALCINVTSLFRRPEFYQALGQQVLPRLHTYPFIRIWHAGCATGEEVFSTAILLQEEGLYDRCRIYATDINTIALEQARTGLLPLEGLEAAGARYRQSGGRQELSEYYTLTKNGAIFTPALRRNIVFAQHNLASDSSFNEFNLIFCRNVLIYFSKSLQGRVHELFYRSLAVFGVLALGSQESLHFSPYEHAYQELCGDNKLYRRIA
ncbi:MAG TPA: protein-glutamate O-methyltransferase CheR [Verrucomicrobiae bacterium]|nr:protein-glutamate O-methyltransferase CheR [Verrucomicrobiae bacterium]